jgi:hypothetical protein
MFNHARLFVLVAGRAHLSFCFQPYILEILARSASP